MSTIKDENREMHIACCRICLLSDKMKNCKNCAFYKDAKDQSGNQIKENKHVGSH